MNETTKSINTGSIWSDPEPDIPQSAVSRTFETDILICGAGNAGLMAAISAAKLGVKTLVIEKNRRIGFIKPYMGAVDTKAQKAAGEKAMINKEEIIQELVNYGIKCTENNPAYGPGYKPSRFAGSNKVDEKLIRLWAEESGSAFDFLADELAEYGIRHVSEYDIALSSVFCIASGSMWCSGAKRKCRNAFTIRFGSRVASAILIASR